MQGTEIRVTVVGTRLSELCYQDVMFDAREGASPSTIVLMPYHLTSPYIALQYAKCLMVRLKVSRADASVIILEQHAMH